MGINLTSRVPQKMTAMSTRMIYAAAVVAAGVITAVVYGFHWRVERKAQMHANAVMQSTAADSAPSNRRSLHSEVPGATPADNLGGTPTSPDLLDKGLNKASDVVHTVANPLGNPIAKPVNLACPPNCINQPSPYIPPAQPATPRLSAREERERREYQRRMAAIEAPTGVSGSSSPSAAVPSSPQATDKLQSALSKLSSLAGEGMPTLPGVGQPGMSREDDDDPNGQAAKRAFQKTGEGDYLKTTRTAPISPWVVERGDVIVAGLPNALVSDLPGDLVAEVKRDVYDSPQHKYVMIPAGSLLAGEYNSAVNYGQKRAQVIWTYLRFPDGSFIDLDKFISHSADGAVGLSDQVDNHLKRLIGGVALSSAFAAGLQISQNRTGGNSTLTYPSNTQLAVSAAGQQAAEFGQQITTRNLNVQPSIRARAGDVFYVSVMKSIIFPGPYKPLQMTGVAR